MALRKESDVTAHPVAGGAAEGAREHKLGPDQAYKDARVLPQVGAGQVRERSQRER